ncbi:hypothetical protein [Natrinema salinisoli]|uniref:hypothetical protein n=1 Tax=Natrinema salinisoli TaxID=2878535 RepID=UPI001CF0C71B|nr:hypothetical protein [Natrinema salinisoli]
MLGRIAIVLIGIVGLYGAMTLYPPLYHVVRWSIPITVVLWGVSRFHLYGFRRPLTVIAGCLLILEGITRGLFQFVPLSELGGAVANLVLVIGIFAEMYAQHYRERE